MKKFHSKEELLKYLTNMFPLISTKAYNIFQWLKSNDIEHSEVTDGIIYASIPVRIFFIFKKKLLMRFHFNQALQLIRIETSESYTGL